MRRQQPAPGTRRDLPTDVGRRDRADGDHAPAATDASGVSHRAPRPAVGTIRLDHLGGRPRVEVELVHAGASVRGSAERTTVAAAAADATALALSELAAPLARFEVTAVDSNTERLVVELTAASAAGAHRFVGAVAINGRGSGDAAVRATLDAVNRSLCRWLDLEAR